MIKYLSSRNVNIFTKIKSRFIIIATVRPYTQEIKNTKNGRLPCKHIYFEKNFNILFLILILINDEYNYNVGTEQIIRKTILKYVLKVYAPNIAFIMPSNHLSYLCFIHYFIYRFIMTDNFQLSYFPIFLTLEPMDIEGEAACAVCPT